MVEAVMEKIWGVQLESDSNKYFTIATSLMKVIETDIGLTIDEVTKNNLNLLIAFKIGISESINVEKVKSQENGILKIMVLFYFCQKLFEIWPKEVFSPTMNTTSLFVDYVQRYIQSLTIFILNYQTYLCTLIENQTKLSLRKYDRCKEKHILTWINYFRKFQRGQRMIDLETNLLCFNQY